MIVGIHQLHYLPWLRYFHKIASSDVFVLLDDVQFTKNDWQNRNVVKTFTGRSTLSVPVHHRLGVRLDELRIRGDSNWRRKHWSTIEQNYSKCPYFEDHAPFLRDTYARPWERLNELNTHMLDYFVAALGIDTRIEYASTLDISGAGSERLVKIIEALGGDAYTCGAHAAENYMDMPLFEAASIAVVLQRWQPPVYAQAHGEFQPELSIVDLLMNCGPRSLDVLRGA